MLLIKSVINLLRLIFLFLLFATLYPFLKNRSIYFFLNFSGPSFIKLGQTLSTRPDLVGENLAKILSNFQDNVKPFGAKTVKKILQRNFGDDFDKIFSEFDYQAKASASIAQVHKARLKSGENVAIKILRPKIVQIMARDIATLGLIIKIVAIFSKFLAGAFNDIRNVLKETSKIELNLMEEAQMAIRLKKNLQNVEGFYVPKIYTQHCSRQILVLEWLDGIAFSNKEKILATKFDKKVIAKNLVISYFSQAYRDGFFHADMHQGNLFLLENGDIGVVDFGIMGEIDRKTRVAIAEILLGYLNKDYEKVAKIHINAGLVPRDVNLLELTISCQKIGEKMVGNSVKEIPLTFILGQLIEMTQKYKMATRPELLLLQKTILLVEGVGLILDENLNIWELARPWVNDWAKKNISLDAKIRDFMVDFVSAVKKFVQS